MQCCNCSVSLLCQGMAVRRFLSGPFLRLASLLVLTLAGMVQSIPRTFTVINSATCRYRYQLPTDKVGTCDYPRCWVAPNLLRTDSKYVYMSMPIEPLAFLHLSSNCTSHFPLKFYCLISCVGLIYSIPPRCYATYSISHKWRTPR